MNLSNRAKKVSESPIRKLAKFGEQAEKQGKKVYYLNIGQPDLEPPKAVFNYLNNLDEQVISYSNSQGEQKYLDSLVDYYHRLGHNDLEHENFIATVGGSEAIHWAFITIANPGDEVLIFEPFYTNFQSLGVMVDVKLVPVQTKVSEGFHLPSKEDIIKKITTKTKAIIICNPNNPTGTVYKKEELEMIYKIAQEKDLYVISDEVYREYVYDDNLAISMLDIEKEQGNDLSDSRVIILDSFSKRYSLCGLRVGLACTRNKKIIEIMIKYGQARLAVGQLNMLIIAEILNQGDEDYLKKIIGEFTKRRKVLIEGLKIIPGVMFWEPEGAFYATVKLPIEDADEFSEWLLTDFSYKDETVMLAPANGFYLTKGLGKDEVRIAYVLNEVDLKKALEILAKALDKWEERRG